VVGLVVDVTRIPKTQDGCRVERVGKGGWVDRFGTIYKV
jgi:hypothetical protein